MSRLTALLAAIIVVLPFPALAQDTNLADLLEQTRKEAGLVGIGGGVMINGEIVAIATDGERIMGSEEPIPSDAVWHLGSITKSMTATLIAALVEDGALTFETTIGDVYGSKAHESWQDVTLHQLLTHRSGAPANFSALTMLAPEPDGNFAISLHRQKKVEAVIAAPLPGEQGSFTYSNVGFTIAGAMAEKSAGGTPWEILVADWVLRPLGISESFGPPRGQTAPWGHGKGLFGKSAKSPEGRADNPAFIGPAGTAALSLPDVLRYGQAHLEQDATILSRASYDQLHTPPVRDEETGEGYAYGWVVEPSGGSLNAGPIIWHNGSNTYWYALLILVPEHDAVIALVSNDGNVAKAQPAFFRLAKQIAEDFDLAP